ncbi:MAG: 4Fe-4S dicluster domain-containing protein, partial [Halobaculum sp.]
NGFQGMAELCHGCGGCRGEQSTTGGVMCPTFRAANEEIQSTRGRANALRQAMSGDLPDDPFTEEFQSEVLDLCIGCKGCKMDCPSGVDMAKMKAEVTHEQHERDGASLRDRLFANVNTLARVGSALAPLSNWATSLPGAGLGKRLLGIATDRDLPNFRRTTFRDWFRERGGSAVAEADAHRTAVLIPDTYTNYTRPAAGKAAVRVLEAAGVRVELADVEDTGRA